MLNNRFSRRRRTRKATWWILAVVAFAIVLIIGRSTEFPSKKLTESAPRGAVTGSTILGIATVVDGDGLEIGGTKIRLFGIDAPEIDQYCRRDDGTRWRCGHYATVALDRLVAGGEVTCSVRDVDRYRRPVAACRIGDVDLAGVQVSNGWAVAYRSFTKSYVDEEEIAKSERRGIWSGDFEMPWAWRNRARGRR